MLEFASCPVSQIKRRTNHSDYKTSSLLASHITRNCFLIINEFEDVGLGDTGVRGRGTEGRETRGRGDVGRGDARTSGLGDVGTRGDSINKQHNIFALNS